MRYWIAITILITLGFPQTVGPSVTSPSSDFTSRELFQLANQYYQIGDYSSAVKLYHKALTESPDLTEARFNLAHTYYRIYQNGPRENREKYLALTVYTYEQVLEKGAFYSNIFGNEYSPAAHNLTEIRTGHHLPSVSRGWIGEVITGLQAYRNFFLHGMGIVFILTVIFFIIHQKKNYCLPYTEENTEVNSSSFLTSQKERIKKWLDWRNKSSRAFPISLGLYLVLLTLFIFLENDLIAMIPTQERGVVAEEVALRKFPQRNTSPFTLVTAGETVLIKEKTTEEPDSTEPQWIRVKTEAGIEGWLEERNIWVIDTRNFPSK